uniref:Uncharacterized protein n=1 Tax=Cacopsylla melanoneura TaxID=428564 RepID=A0A8D8SBS6_9HEMI
MLYIKHCTYFTLLEINMKVWFYSLRIVATYAHIQDCFTKYNNYKKYIRKHILPLNFKEKTFLLIFKIMTVDKITKLLNVEVILKIIMLVLSIYCALLFRFINK